MTGHGVGGSDTRRRGGAAGRRSSRSRCSRRPGPSPHHGHRGLGRVGWRLALPPLIELGGACRAPLRIKHPVDGRRIDRPPFGTRLLEVDSSATSAPDLGAFAIDLAGSATRGVRAIAPLVLEHRGHLPSGC